MKALPLLFFIACAAKVQPASAPPAPDLMLLQHTLEPGVCETKMRFAFSLSHARPTPLRLERFEASIVQNGVPLATSAGPLALEVQKELAFDVVVPIPRGACRPGAASAPTASTGDRVEINGKLFGAAPEPVIFEFEGADILPAERPVQLRAELRGQRSDRGRLDLYAVFWLLNPNAHALVIDELGFAVRIGGSLVAQGGTFERERLREQARTSREVRLDIDIADRAIKSLLDQGKSPYEIELTLRIGDSAHVQTERGVFSF